MASSTVFFACRLQRRGKKAGFSLIELLVVIAVIAVLLALALPMFGKAREAANSVKCESQERQILHAMMAHADSHDGYMPMVGMPHPTAAYPPPTDPVSLQDPQRERYDYYGTSSANFQLMTIEGALAPQLGQVINTTSETSVQNSIDTGLIRTIFHCPSDANESQIIGNIVFNGGSGYASYAFNEAALGWGTSLTVDNSNLMATPEQHSRLRAKVTRFVHPSELFLFTDGKVRSDGWLLYCDANSNLSLADFFTTTYGPPNNPNASANPQFCAAWDVIDTKRHHGRMNVAFADGHVETVSIDVGTLSNISANKDFPAF